MLRQSVVLMNGQNREQPPEQPPEPPPQQQQMRMEIQYRPLVTTDQEIVWRMLQHAAHESSLDDVQSNPLLTPYAHDFGQFPGDVGFVALEKGFPVGAAWVRVFGTKGLATAHLGDHNSHYRLLKDLPELAIACLPQYRGRGIGSCLLKMLLQQVQHAQHFQGICLSCRQGNEAMTLYERVGFVSVAGSVQTNRAGGTSITMQYLFDEHQDVTC